MNYDEAVKKGYHRNPRNFRKKTKIFWWRLTDIRLKWSLILSAIIMSVGVSALFVGIVEFSNMPTLPISGSAIIIAAISLLITRETKKRML